MSSDAEARRGVLASSSVTRAVSIHVWMALALLCSLPGSVELLASEVAGSECCADDCSGCDLGGSSDCADCACCAPLAAVAAGDQGLRVLPAPALEGPRAVREVDAPGYPVLPFRPPAA
jgi:hypothetical protein